MRLAVGSAIPLRSKPRGHRPTPWKWRCPILPAPPIAPRSDPVARFQQVWGKQAFAITWAADAGHECDTPGPSPGGVPPQRLDTVQRGLASDTYDRMAESIASFEASAESTSFTSEFDAVVAGTAKFTPQEQRGDDLFRGGAHCDACHRDGGPGEEPLFTDLSASNIGVPANPSLPFHAENQRDAQGYAANPAGRAYVGAGVGGTRASPAGFKYRRCEPWTRGRIQAS